MTATTPTESTIPRRSRPNAQALAGALHSRGVPVLGAHMGDAETRAGHQRVRYCFSE